MKPQNLKLQINLPNPTEEEKKTAKNLFKNYQNPQFLKNNNNFLENQEFQKQLINQYNKYEKAKNSKEFQNQIKSLNTKKTNLQKEFKENHLKQQNLLDAIQIELNNRKEDFNNQGRDIIEQKLAFYSTLYNILNPDNPQYQELPRNSQDKDMKTINKILNNNANQKPQTDQGNINEKKKKVIDYINQNSNRFNKNNDETTDQTIKTLTSDLTQILEANTIDYNELYNKYLLVSNMKEMLKKEKQKFDDYDTQLNFLREQQKELEATQLKHQDEIQKIDKQINDLKEKQEENNQIINNYNKTITKHVEERIKKDRENQRINGYIEERLKEHLSNNTDIEKCKKHILKNNPKILEKHDNELKKAIQDETTLYVAKQYLLQSNIDNKTRKNTSLKLQTILSKHSELKDIPEKDKKAFNNTCKDLVDEFAKSHNKEIKRSVWERFKRALSEFFKTRKIHQQAQKIGKKAIMGVQQHTHPHQTNQKSKYIHNH